MIKNYTQKTAALKNNPTLIQLLINYGTEHTLGWFDQSTGFNPECWVVHSNLLSEINSIAGLNITHTLSYFLSHCPATFILNNNNGILYNAYYCCSVIYINFP